MSGLADLIQMTCRVASRVYTLVPFMTMLRWFHDDSLYPQVRDGASLLLAELP